MRGDVAESTWTAKRRFIAAPSWLARLFPIPWRNKWFWGACLLVVTGFGALNTRYHSLGSHRIAMAVPYDGRMESHYPRDYGWPWSAVRITKVYDSRSLPGNALLKRQIVEFEWPGVLGNVAVLAVALAIVARSYAIAERRQWKGIRAAAPLQFKLRSFFVALTLVAVWLRITVREAAVQKEVLDELRGHGALITYEYHLHGVTPANPGFTTIEPPNQWLRQILGSEWGLRVVEVNAAPLNGDVGMQLRSLSRLKGVVAVGFVAHNFADDENLEILDALQHLPSLQRVSANGISESMRHTYQGALPYCTIIPYAGQSAFVEARFRENALRAFPNDAGLREWASRQQQENDTN